MPDEDDPAGVVVVRPATAQDLADLLAGGDAFERRTGWRVVPGWSSFDGVLEHSAAELERGVPARWSTHLFLVHQPDGSTALVGVGGFKGPPVGGVVEIGYEVAPSHRRRGVATSAARLLVDQARRDGCSLVTAHTLAEENPSTAILTRLGFAVTATVVDPDEGSVWRWELPLTA